MYLVQQLSFLDLENRSLWVDFCSSPALEPGYRAAGRSPAGCYSAQMLRGKGLEQGAAVENIHILVLHAPQPVVSFLKYFSRILPEFFGSFCIRVNAHLHLLYHRPISLEQLDERCPDMPQTQAFLSSLLADPAPDSVSRIEMH